MNNSNRSDTTTRLSQRRASSRYRQRQVRHSDIATSRQFNGNDYLSLSGHPDLIKAAKDALDDWGTGSSGSPLLSGYTAAHQALEEALADWLNVDGVLLFNSGFAANHGVVTSLIGEGERLFCDRLCHASLLDGVRHSQRRFKRFQHNRFDGLSLNDGDWLITEGTYSMDGDRIAANKALPVLNQQRVNLLLDDAHGLGVHGSKGRGTYPAIAQHTRVLIGTFGKAFGVGGAFVAGCIDDIDMLIQFCREYIYSTSFPPAQAAAVHASLNLIQGQEGEQRRQQLAERIAQFKQHMQARALGRIDSDSAIQVWLVGDDEQAMRIAQQLQERGFWVSAVRPPTVPENTARLRFSLQAAHSAADIDSLFMAIDQIRGEQPC